MTPQLQQAIKLLQLSNMELASFVESELEQNPLLERADDFEPDNAEFDGAVGDGDEDFAVDDSLAQTESETLPSAAEAPLDTEYENYYQSDGPGDQQAAGAPDHDGGSFESWGASKPVNFGGEDFSAEQRMADEMTLRQHLLGQLHIEFGDPIDRLIGLHLIDLLDEAGYLKADLEDLALRLGSSMERVEAVIARLQGFDPTGVFARSLGECLALQLAELDRLDPAMAAMLDRLDLVAKGDYSALRRHCGVDAEDIADMIQEIRALDPKPALAFGAGPASAIVPDIIMRPHPKTGWIIELNSETLPRVLMNNHYYRQVLGRVRDKEQRGYISECYQSANWLLKSLDQRANTILKVASEIVRQQDDFFQKGIEFMKPLTLRHIAEVIEMHESTVSRVTSNKFMVTPRGTFELKYFFTAAIGGVDGASHSAESVRHRIRLLIDKEPCNKILSDDRIVHILRGDGVDIARRTVAKYREAMRIPSSVQRRREKAAFV